MKIILPLAVLLFISAISANAQDLITKKDGTTIDAKIISVSDNIVEYKRSNYLDGPTFSISVLDLDTIRYASGDVQKFEDKEAEAVTEKGITLGMKYSEYKHLYNAHDYVYDYRDHYSPVGAGLSSFIFGGVGQMMNGQTLKGIGMLVGTVGLTIAGFCVCDRVKEGDKTVLYSNGGSIACWCGALAIDIWSIIDAVNVAKIKNLYWRDCEHLMASRSFDIKLRPDLAFVQTGQGLSPTAGVVLAIRF